MFKSKKLVALGLAAVALFSTVGVSLAYWANSVTGNSDTGVTGTVNVGTGGTVTTTVSVADATAGLQLVPSGFENGTTTTAQADIVFSVNWTSTGADGAGASSTLSVSQTAKVAKNASAVDVTSTVGSLYVVTLPASTSITADAAATTVHVYVTLTEPTFAQYPDVAGGNLVLTLTFTVA